MTTLTKEETAREHIRNALAIVGAYRQAVEQPVDGLGVFIESRDLRAVEARLYRAMEQIERGNA
jgi:hypothetical protein